MVFSIPAKHKASEISIFSRMSALAQQHKAINLSQGFPDFAIDDRLGEYLLQAVKDGYNQYAPMQGIPLLREAISDDFNVRYLLSIDWESEVTVVPGATHGIYTAINTIIRQGDEVIVLEPAYDSYIPCIELAGGIPVPIPMFAPEYTVDWDLVAASITERTRAIMVNTPHNPTGTCFSQEDWNILATIVRDREIYIISDEVYEQLVFDSKPHFSVLLNPELRERSFAVFSFGKVFNNTGWKVGFVVASPLLTHAFRKLHQYTSFSVNTPAQFATARFLSLPNREVPAQQLQRKRDYFLDKLKQTPFTVYKPAAGSYFQIVGYQNISDMPDADFAEWLTIEHGVATIPLSAFYQKKKNERLIRFCFAKREETIDAAIERLCKL